MVLILSIVFAYLNSQAKINKIKLEFLQILALYKNTF